MNRGEWWKTQPGLGFMSHYEKPSVLHTQDALCALQSGFCMRGRSGSRDSVRRPSWKAESGKDSGWS